MLKTTLSLFSVLAASSALAQTATPEGPPPDAVYFTQQTFGMGPEPITIVSRDAVSLASGKPVTGAPFSAEQVTEHVQTLADGNRIVNTTKTKLYRDAQGRTRTEISPDPLPGTPALRSMIRISDPVANVTYLLDQEDKAAKKVTSGGVALSLKGGAGGPPLPPLASESGGQTFFKVITRDEKQEVKTEDLGTQQMNGLRVTGTRTTMTIPAGAIGNEQPIETVTERWYSPDLQIVVKSVHSDPRMGTTTETLNDLSRVEPPAALFQVPADYNIEAVKEPTIKTRVLKLPE